MYINWDTTQIDEKWKHKTLCYFNRRNTMLAAHWKASKQGVMTQNRVKDRRTDKWIHRIQELCKMVVPVEVLILLFDFFFSTTECSSLSAVIFFFFLQSFYSFKGLSSLSLAQLLESEDLNKVNAKVPSSSHIFIPVPLTWEPKMTTTLRCHLHHDLALLEWVVNFSYSVTGVT